MLAGCMGGEAPSYGGTDVAVAVDALARTASTLQADLRSERRANEAFENRILHRVQKANLDRQLETKMAYREPVLPL